MGHFVRALGKVGDKATENEVEIIVKIKILIY